MLTLLVVIGFLLMIHLIELSDVSFRLIGWVTFSIVLVSVTKTLIFIIIMTFKTIYTKIKNCK